MNGTPPRASSTEKRNAPAEGPAAPVGARWTGLFALAWLGVWLAQLTPFQLLLPTQLNTVLGIGSTLRQDNWQRSVVDFGLVSGLSAACTVVAFPLAGALSDRTASRYGRRRPWILAGAVLFAGSLVALGTQNTVFGIAFWWCAAMTGFCFVASALTAMIGDGVPTAQRGIVSSAIAAPQALGLILGVAVVATLALDAAQGYTFAAIILMSCVLPFVWCTPDPTLATVSQRGQSVRELLGFRDFRWVLTSRALINLGNTLGTSLLLFYLQFGLEVSEPGSSLLVLTTVYMVVLTIAAVCCGWMSDRIRRRRPFVFAAGALQSIAAVIVISTESFNGTVFSSALVAGGYGCFLAVDQALAADVLPSADHSGKDLGVMNIALAVPQAIGPLIGAGIVFLSSGFAGLFITAAVCTILGGAAVLRVQTVR
ncbi:MFS transporter [Nocardia sp. NBC_00508]|uniref:MFS transporter n=1 Tax=Nocardia sp. NBC_00508 TaxID=2975992 RepID=UPI002E82174F|nr:MFS transporter [Nocardia sp. NBC_00508]WUD66008.1 MFS transporter [Nocardia sp. NBC_00508]